MTKMEKRMNELVEEVVQGIIVREIQPNSSIDFSGKIMADYFSNTCKNMKSDTFHMIAYGNQQNTNEMFKDILEECHAVGR